MSRLLSYGLFLAVVLSLWGGIHLYMWARLVRDTGLAGPWRWAASGLLVGLALLPPVAIVAKRVLQWDLGEPLYWLGFTWAGVMFLLFVTLASVDLLRLLGHGAGRIFGTEPADPTRRLLLARVAGGAATVFAAGTGAIAMRSALRAPRVVEVPVELRRLPPLHDGFAIVQITDLHVGPTIGASEVHDLVRRTNALQPDVIAITGDLVDGGVEELRAAVAPLGELRARHGVYFVTGNHEYYSGPDAWIAELRRLGVRVLRNERVALGEGADGFDLAGIDDLSAHRYGRGHGADLDAALAGRDPRRELVLLAHQPRAFVEAAQAGVGLQLSGHTHGGQIWPFHYAVVAQQGWLAGLAREGESQLYVSRGTGYWGPPLRLGAPAELTRVVLRSALTTAEHARMMAG